MSLKTFLAKTFAKKIYYKTQIWANNPIKTQQKVLKDLIFQAQNTKFGKDHRFSEIKTFIDFAKNERLRGGRDRKGGKPSTIAAFKIIRQSFE